MIEINLKDRKILYQLDLNCRQSNTCIGKKATLSKEVVNYKIKRMEEYGRFRYIFFYILGLINLLIF